MTIEPKCVLRQVIDPKFERAEKPKYGVIMNKVISTTCTRCRQDIIHCRCDVLPARRVPLEDGTLKLTKEELAELGNIISIDDIYKVIYVDRFIHIRSKYWNDKIISDVEAIIYLIKRFKLEED